MKRLIIIVLCSIASIVIIAQTSYDLVIVGGTPGGIMTAIAASREGKTSVIIERTDFIGGLPVNGLGATDIATRQATTGLFKEFIDLQLAHYVKTYGADSKQVRDCSEGYHFEPKIAAQTFDQMIGQEKNITILKMRQFDALPKNITMDGDRIVSIRATNRVTKKIEKYTGKIFIDATYEGDLGAAANIPFSLGRESRSEYNEIGAGRIYKLWKGPEMGGTTHEADNALQAYNYRLCLTNETQNKHLPNKPKRYNRDEYISLIEDILTGTHTGVEMLKVTPEMQENNRKHVLEGGKTQIPGDPWGMPKISSMTRLPNSKVDANNQHLALISTDLPEENWEWPTADWEWRDRFAQRLKDYTLGLLYFAQNDSDLPEHFRKAAREWGLAKDEYQDNEYFPRQVYVREGRRFHGEYFFTANDALPMSEGKRPPLHQNSITASHYALDSHAVHKREKGKGQLDGFFSYPSAVYTIPYGVIVPKTVSNLLIPVPVSGTHVGFSTLRMEPCWMALGEAAGIAASLAIDNVTSMKNVNVDEIQSRLINGKATLIYFKDVNVEHPLFAATQHMGLRGYLPDWEADLDKLVDAETARKWSDISGIEFEWQDKTRGEVLNTLYSLIK